MKNVSRVLALFVGFAMLAAACGGSTTDATGGSDGTPTTATGSDGTPTTATGSDETPTTATGSDETPTTATEQELITVRIGEGPYLDYMPWQIADKLGFAEEFGLKLEFTTFASPVDSVKQILRGDLDIAFHSHPGLIPSIGAAPEIRNWMITDQFSGFRIIGRRGEVPTYDDLEAEVGSAEALEQVLESWIGKEFVIVGALFTGLVDGALSQIDSSVDDVTILEFANDAQAAQAFLGGTGDYYTGSLPQTTKLLFDFGDQFVSVGGTEVLGAGGLWFSTEITSAEWLEENRDVAMRLLGAWYRSTRFLAEVPDKAIPLMREQLNELAAATFTDEEVKFLVDNLVALMTFEEAKERAFNPDSDIYWRISVDHYVAVNQEVLPAGFEVDDVFLDEEIFREFASNSSLVDQVQAPFDDE